MLSSKIKRRTLKYRRMDDSIVNVNLIGYPCKHMPQEFDEKNPKSEFLKNIEKHKP